MFPRHNGGNMGRPTFNIDGQRLRDLREEMGKTQLAIAKEIHARLGQKKHPSTDKTLESDYQRIERTGRTSRQRAEVIAEIFGVTVEVLQGKGVPEPRNYLAGIASYLHERFSTGASEALIEALEQSANTREPSEESINFLAEDIGERIEAAQLGRNPSELAELTELTGMPASELLKPANVLGHWLVIANGPGIHRTEFVRRVSGLNWHLKDFIGDRLDYRGSDASVVMHRDDPWFRLEIRRSANPNDVFRFDFVRCDPSDGTGIRWTSANWREYFELDWSFKRWAYSAANFVTDFDGQQSPAGDVRRLRLLVTEYGRTHKPTGRLVVAGNLDEMDDEIVQRFRKENSTHHVVQSWLTNDLKLSLAPFLAEYPRKCWRIDGAGQVLIELNELEARKQPFLDCYFGRKYQINLVEEIGGNQFTPVPWRNKDIERLQKDIEKMLDDPNDRFWVTDEPRRTFEPYEAEE